MTDAQFEELVALVRDIAAKVERLEDQRHPSTLSPEGFEDRLRRFREAEAAMAGEEGR